jgi:putative spermidine/putrescine transport system permease protein
VGARRYCDLRSKAAGQSVADGGLTIKLSASTVSYLQVSPLLLVLIAFFGIPLLMIVSVSFFEFDGISSVPAFQFGNYAELFTSQITLTLYLKTIEYALIVWAITLLIGFTVSYYLAFHIRTILWQMALFLLCTVPFWTSNIIRMISWIPFLGRNGLFNQALMALGVTDKPLEFLLFSDFAVIVAYVHLFTLFMIVPIFNSMARIDRSVVEAALDGGSSRWRIIWEIIIPLSKTGIALGSIFVITLVMGDFYVVNTMSGGHSASVVLAMYNQIAAVQYPWAAASAVLLLLIVTLMVAAILRLVDVRRELSR